MQNYKPAKPSKRKVLNHCLNVITFIKDKSSLVMFYLLVSIVGRFPLRPSCPPSRVFDDLSHEFRDVDAKSEEEGLDDEHKTGKAMMV